MSKPAEKATAYSYIRFSSLKQSEGDSVRRQTELREAWLFKSGAVLDTSFTLKDEGVSAFAGKHRQNPDRHALAMFLELVNRGRVQRGSYLIVESLDRLSREHIRPALTLLLNLIEAGIRVVQLLPVEAVYDESVEPMQLMMAIMELSRGHAESEMKSKRVGPAWRKKKLAAAIDRKPITRRCPSWLHVVDGEWKFRQPAASVARRIVRLCIEGDGIDVIVKRLNKEKVETLGIGKQKSKYWAESSVSKILHNRALVGEYQPHIGSFKNGNRKPDGEPIPGYYPALIGEQEWYAMQAALASRRNKAGRPAKRRMNLFANLLYDAKSQGRIHLCDKGKESSGIILLPYREKTGASNAKPTSFPLEVFEKAVLSKLKEIDPHDILTSNVAADKVLALTGKVENIKGRIDKIKAQLVEEDDDPNSSIASVLRALDINLQAANKELAEAEREAASPLSSAWGECKGLLEAVSTGPDLDEKRTRLRSTMRRIMESIWCLFVARPPWRMAAVQIRFTGGQHRDYLILHKQGQGNGSAKRKPKTLPVMTFADIADADDLDLRRKADVKLLTKTLEGLDLDRLAD